MAGSHRHALVALTGSQLSGTEALSVVHCLEAKVPCLSPFASSLSQEVMGRDWPVPSPSDTIYGTFGSLAKVVPTMVPQNALVPVLPILSPVPHQCRGPPSLSVILLWLTLSRGGSVHWLND